MAKESKEDQYSHDISYYFFWFWIMKIRKVLKKNRGEE